MSRSRNDFDYDKDVDVKVDVDVDYSSDTNIDFDVDAKEDIYWDPKVEDNTAQLFLDAEAIGDDTLVLVESSVLTVDNEMSSVTLSVLSVAI